MKKFITFVFMITVISVLYVQMKVEIYTTGYCLQNNRVELASLVDENSELLYELSRMESPGFLLAQLEGETMEFANNIRRRDNKNYFHIAERTTETLPESAFSRFMDIFTESAEALPED
jgi:hypothetical protein